MGIVIIIRKLLGIYPDENPEEKKHPIDKMEEEHRAGHFSDDMSHVIPWKGREEIEIIGEDEENGEQEEDTEN